MATSTDYDAPRTTVDADDSLEELKARRATPNQTAADVDDSDLADGFELPGGEQLDEELTVTVVPMQNDEFRCSRCFLVRHRNQRATVGQDICVDCS